MILKILSAVPNIPLMLDKEEQLLFKKWLFWSKGIPPSVFRKQQLRDINDVLAIDEAVSQKKISEAEIKNMISQMVN